MTCGLACNEAANEAAGSDKEAASAIASENLHGITISIVGGLGDVATC